MGSLVHCACGHGIEDHREVGCAHVGCRCRRGYTGALDAAIDGVRTPLEIREQQQTRYHKYKSAGRTADASDSDEA